MVVRVFISILAIFLQFTDKFVHVSGHGVEGNHLNNTFQKHDGFSKEDTIGLHKSLKETDLFINAIFTKYGHNGTLPFEGYEHLLQNLRIGNIDTFHSWELHLTKKLKLFNFHGGNHSHGVVINASGIVNRDHDHKDGNHKQHVGGIRETGSENFENAAVSDGINKRSTRGIDSQTQVEDEISKCFRPEELLHLYGYSANNAITPEQFLQLCPALVSQIDIRRCGKTWYNIDGTEAETGSLNLLRSIADIPKEVWGFATCAVLVISFAGLMVVSMIPLLRKMMMSSVLHFLIALAVGALSGDALLHLIPHSLQPNEETHNHQDEVGDKGTSHNLNGVYKGLCGLTAIYFFLFFGQIQAIVGSRKSKGKHIHVPGETTQKIVDKSEYEKDPSQNEPFIKNPTNQKMVINGSSDDHNHAHELQSHDLEHGHCNGHSHSHEVPSSIPDLAWRVIIGDGIHNLCDGLAVGVAFSNSVTGGISTSIAVLCHELPHEMGDFAILLQKGMTVKQAILCNCISSVLSLIGMVTGVLLGNIGQANLWIFVAVAGMFLYISLVDLIPELNTIVITNSGTKDQVKALLIQASGMLTGSGIMMIIAMYEEQLKRILDV